MQYKGKELNPIDDYSVIDWQHGESEKFYVKVVLGGQYTPSL